MQVIVPAASLIDDIVGKQKRIEGQHYRLMTYVIKCPVEDGVLLYHTLTCCMVWLTCEEAANLTSQQELIDLWFLVPERHDDHKLCEQIRKMAVLFQPPAKNITGYTILTTTGCNARCFYCYEKGTKPVTMTAETATKVSCYIREHRGKEKVGISWFGGEPLVNVKVIDQICTDLKEHEVPFRSSMISNAYLFDTDIVRRAKDLWQLKRVQITLDGMEQTYNQVKAYVYKNVNAFEQVLKNIELLTAEEIKVSIRLNVDHHNIDEMAQLVSLLHQRFGDNKHLSIYSHELFGERTLENRAMLYEQRMQLEQQIVKWGYGQKRRLQKDIKLNHCMADRDQSVIISPGGYLGKCEHYIDSEFFGHVDTEERDEAILRKFKERPADIEACATCSYYPQCHRLTMCPNGNPLTILS
jgi:radical SAM protein with 4Fe4S-binding SPASM domain